MAEQPTRVLCVENDPMVCDTLGRLLCPPDFCWLGAVPSGDDLDEAVERERADLVVLCMRPGDEAGAVAWVRRVKAERPRLRAAFLTTVADPAWLAEAIAAGVDGLFSKFDSPTDLRALLAAVMRGQFVVSPETRPLLW